MQCDKNAAVIIAKTIHSDRHGYDRLTNLYRKMRPRIIALEWSDARGDVKDNKELDYKRMHEMILGWNLQLNTRQEGILIEFLKEHNNLGSQVFKASQAYVEQNPECTLHYIDTSVFRNEKKEFQEKYYGIANLHYKAISEDLLSKRKLDAGLASCIEYLDSVTHDAYSGNIFGIDFKEFYDLLKSEKTWKLVEKEISPKQIESLKEIYDPKRDEEMASKIKELYGKSNGSNKIVAVVGLYHSFGLKERLADINPII